MWWVLLPYVLVTAALILVPGFAINKLAGFRTHTALALAPLVSTAVVGAAAILADWVGLAWGPLPIGAVTVLLCLISLAVRKLSARLDLDAPPRPEGHAARASASEAEGRSLGWTIAGLVVAFALLGRDSLRMLGAPTNFSQTYDNVFHLNTVRWMLDHRNGSALNMRLVTGDDPAGFYPTAWHDLASASSLMLGVKEPVYATNALVIVTLAIVWPLSCFLLFRRLIAPSQPGMVTIGVLTACSAAFPYLLMGFGVLYPNYLGLCLLPAMMALAANVFRLAAERTTHWPVLASWLAAGYGMVALLLAHPNVALSMISVFGLAMVMAWALPSSWQAARRRNWTRTDGLKLAACLGWGIAAMALWIKVRPPSAISTWGPSRPISDAVFELITLSPMEASVIWLPAALTVVGAVSVLVNKRNRWLLLAHAAVSLLWLTAASLELGLLRYLLVGPFYNDPFRVGALLPMTALPLAGLGVVFLSSGLQRLVPRVDERLIGIVVGVLLVVATQFGAGKAAMLDYVAVSYRMSERAPLVDSDEYAVLMSVEELVPPGEVIAVNPWNGSSMVYALTGRQVTAPHVFFEADRETQILLDHLDDASSEPKVCPVLDELRVGWVLDFGLDDLLHDHQMTAPGWDDLANSPGFEVVAQQGHAALYRVTACD